MAVAAVNCLMGRMVLIPKQVGFLITGQEVLRGCRVNFHVDFVDFAGARLVSSRLWGAPMFSVSGL